VLVGRQSGATAALVISRIEATDPSAVQILGTAYNLTRREVAVTATIVQLGGVAAAAEALGLAPETVRTHLKAIFRKTGIHRQADLAFAVASASEPLKLGPRTST